MTNTTKSNTATKATQVEMEEMNTPAQKEYDNEKRIVIFENNKRTKGVNQPSMRGHFTLNGKIYDVSIWCKYYPKDGKVYKMMQGEIQERGTFKNDGNLSMDDFFDEDQARALTKK